MFPLVFCDVNLVTPVVIQRWAQVVAINPMGVPRDTLVWFLVCNDADAKGAP
jgi:hypothetical protein